MKPPAFQFYVKDWKADTDSLSIEAKGAWIQIICTLHLSEKRGVASKTLAAWSRIFGVTEEVAEHILREIQSDQCATVTFRRGKVTVMSRRLSRERKERESAANRKRRQRASGGGHEKVTPYTASATATAQQDDLPGALDTPEFKTAWGEWEKFRKEIRHGLTDSTRTKQLKMLATHGSQVAVAMIEQSITNGWQGLFPIKDVAGASEAAVPKRRQGQNVAEVLGLDGAK